MAKDKREEASEVKVWVDKEYVDKLIREREEGMKNEPLKYMRFIIDRKKRQGEKGLEEDKSKLNLYEESALGKEERLFKLTHAIRNGRVKTIQDAEKLLLVKKSTVLKYLKELKMALYDKETEKFIDYSKEDVDK